MPEENLRPEDREEHPSVRHEHSDASFRWILYLLIGAGILAAAIHGILLVFHNKYAGYQANIKKSPFPLAPKPSQALPAEPRLEQVDRLAEIERPDVYVRQEVKEEVLNSLGRIGEKGFVHIPIDRAMRLLAGPMKNQVPSRKGPPPGIGLRSNGLVDAGESNSGRMFQRRPQWFEH